MHDDFEYWFFPPVFAVKSIRKHFSYTPTFPVKLRYINIPSPRYIMTTTISVGLRLINSTVMKSLLSVLAFVIPVTIFTSCSPDEEPSGGDVPVGKTFTVAVPGIGQSLASA